MGQRTDVLTTSDGLQPLSQQAFFNSPRGTGDQISSKRLTRHCFISRYTCLIHSHVDEGEHMVQISWAEAIKPSGSYACARRGHYLLGFATRHLIKAVNAVRLCQTILLKARSLLPDSNLIIFCMDVCVASSHTTLTIESWYL
jgi:hypothetical protein